MSKDPRGFTSFPEDQTFAEGFLDSLKQKILGGETEPSQATKKKRMSKSDSYTDSKVSKYFDKMDQRHLERLEKLCNQGKEVACKELERIKASAIKAAEPEAPTTEPQMSFQFGEPEPEPEPEVTDADLDVYAGMSDDDMKAAGQTRNLSDRLRAMIANYEDDEPPVQNRAQRRAAASGKKGSSTDTKRTPEQIAKIKAARKKKRQQKKKTRRTNREQIDPVPPNKLVISESIIDRWHKLAGIKREYNEKI